MLASPIPPSLPGPSRSSLDDLESLSERSPSPSSHPLDLSSLPIELISRILHLLLLSYPARTAPRALLPLLLVSRTIYNIALSTPSLWTSLRLTDTGITPRLQLQLERSGALPLDIEITVRCRSHKSLPCKAGISALMDSLASLRPSMSRWESLDLNLSSCWLAQEALATCGTALFSLSKLTVRTGHSDSGDYATPLPSVLLHMPKLREINFQWYNFRWVQSCTLPSVRALRLSSYYMDDPGLATELLEMLRALPELERLEMDTVAERWVPRLSQPPAFEPVELPRLRSLKMRDCGQDKVLVLLRDIRCPNVQCLEMDMLGHISPLLEVLAGEEHMWERLEEVKVVACEFTAANMMLWLRRMPALRKLEIRDCSQMNKAVSDLVWLAEGCARVSLNDLVELTVLEGRQFCTLHLPSLSINLQ
ncbi:hypothetical protein DACRYDRAFT_98212 [Dacryopinax primogenitus]|uniref:Uncharacterized protein n=1 Tax=Dacryopinax primogenitus (strain DJM 731) TaxID=1858805 RepID=M5GAU9_DACPD|nr:uncharacterized protein DACRYDRAFT_98212 [Dacryopinax primogenitus]EJU05505.1 hypothetical protein DACRYDRAFT_98212 [Dacryopinax primogenitus]